MKILLMLAASFAAYSLPTAAAPYTLFIYEAPEQLALRPAQGEASSAYWAAYDLFGKELAAAGVLRGGSALSAGAPVSVVTANGAGSAAAPYATSPLLLGGYFQIDVGSAAEAVAWASRVPTGGVGLVEVRAGYPVPGMAM